MNTQTKSVPAVRDIRTYTQEEVVCAVSTRIGEILCDQKHWTKAAYARDALNRSVEQGGPEGHTAEKYCLVGGARQAYIDLFGTVIWDDSVYPYGQDVALRIMGEMVRAIGMKTGREYPDCPGWIKEMRARAIITDWNDQETTTFEDIQEVVRYVQEKLCLTVTPPAPVEE